MKRQHFFYVGLGVLLLALLVACGQVPIAEPEPGQPAPAEVLAPQAEASGQNNIEALPTAGVEPYPLAWPPRPTQFPVADAEVTSLDETAIDPADRKFFSPGYGAQTVMFREAEVLPTVVKDEVDPDQDIGLLEFFSPGYGASSDGSKEAEVLPPIDPADRKFFTPGYGVDAGGNDLTAYHQSEWDRTPNTALGVEENALAAYHQSEWGRMPNVTLPVGENTLAAYHQSEWGRTLSPGLPSAKTETDADQDLGLMDFSPVVNEVGLQRHDREYGRAAFSNLPEIDADQDIGLMEFITVPDETSRQRTEPGTLEVLPTIDPADRKFFSPGYGAQTVISREAEELPTIDPADRKFFNPGYGAQIIMPKEADPLPTIDPADRKFFSPGYGAMSGGSKEAEALPAIDPADRKFFSPGYGAQTVTSREAEVLPSVVKAEVGPDEDIGLLEFFKPQLSFE